MLFLLPVSQLTRSQKMSLGLALAQLRHDHGLFEEGYLHLFPTMTKELCDFENILQAAQFVYTCACFHAQTQHPTFGPKIKKILA